MPITILENGHLTEDVLEEYAFGRLSEPETAAVEEHYLGCEACQAALEQVEGQIHIIRSALTVEAGAPRAEPARWWDRVTAGVARTLRVPSNAVWTGALAAACVVAFLAIDRGPTPAPAPVMESVAC